MTNVSFTDDDGCIGGALFVRSGTVSGNGVTFQEDRTTAATAAPRICSADGDVHEHDDRGFGRTRRNPRDR